MKLGEKKLLTLEEMNEIRKTVNIVQEKVNSAQPRTNDDFIARKYNEEDFPLFLDLLDGGPPPPLDLDTGKK